LDLVGRSAPDPLASTVVAYAHGGAKKLGAFWADRPCLVVFLRHLACPGCWSQVDQLLAHLPALQAAGARVVLVGLADPARLLPFRERARLEDAAVELVTDPTLACHREAGMLRSRWSVVRPAAVAEAVRLYFSGYFVRHEEGDGVLDQQGGAILVDRGGEVLFHHVARDLSDYVDLEAVLAVLRGRRRAA
jgi:peroxiredoxin